MPARSRLLIPLLAAAALVVLGVSLVLLSKRVDDAPPEPSRHLAHLGEPPAWAELARYDRVLTREEFEHLLRTVYVLHDDWHCRLTDEAVFVEARGVDGGQRIAFATAGEHVTPPRYWRPAGQLGPAPDGEPLAGLRIAIDPGHLGGEFAKVEERWYRRGDRLPVAEGDLTLHTAKLLKPRLEALGAQVSLVRDAPQPVTALRPDDFLSYAARAMPGADREARRDFAEKLFYRTAEIRARAERVNEEIRPDLVLCLHFNAENWGGDPANPQFSPANHFHMILHGAYLPDELAHEDERFEMMQKVFQRIHDEELALSAELARAFLAETGLTPYRYAPGKPAIELGLALWARNLLANRLYRCPVIFFEPYVMNNEEVFLRVQAGDYEGEREVAGKLRKSLYREYADAVVTGLVNYYESRRSRVQGSE